MNSCHVCNTIPKKDQIISCDNCQNNYCLKCIKTHLNEPSIQKYSYHQYRTFLICNFDTIKQKKLTKSWLCFSCNKQCLCMPCKGNSLVTIEKQLLGQKQSPSIKRKIQDFQKYFPQIDLFRNLNFAQLSPFEQEYFMNKAMLYCRGNESEITGRKHLDQSNFKQVPQRIQPNQNVIQIDSEQNVEGQIPIQEQENQDKQEMPQENEQNLSMELQGQQNNNSQQKNPENIGQSEKNDENDKIIEEPKQDIVPEGAQGEVKAIPTGENEGNN